MNGSEEYFSFERFSHRDLWREGEPIWSAFQWLNDYLRDQVFKIEIKIPHGVHLERPEWIGIGKGTVIEPGVFIEGPCLIGQGCILRNGAYLRDSVICGDHCTIGHSSEVKHSVLLNYAAIAHFNYVGDSIVGSFANLGAGVKCANLRLDRREVSIFSKGKKIKTGLRKFGAVIGDRVQIGCNCVLNPGTLVGKDSVSEPLLNFGGTIPPHSRIVGERKVKIEPMSKPLLALMENMEKTHVSR